MPKNTLGFWWKNMSIEEKIDRLKLKENSRIDRDAGRNVKKQERLDQAMTEIEKWIDWRRGKGDKEEHVMEEEDREEPSTVSSTDPDEEEHPGWSNSSLKPLPTPEKLEGGDQGGEGGIMKS